jgi:REase_DpnII-MboI
VKTSDEAKRIHEQIDWGKLRDLREVESLAARAVEVLKGARMADIDNFISSTQIHQVIWIQAGKQYSSTPSNISTALQRFKGLLEKRQLDFLKFRFPKSSSTEIDQTLQHLDDVDSLLLAICERFHRAIVHLSHRRKGRPTIDFSDEYDVQDVFGTILKCSYNDVRDEEWTPSYGSKSARIDFVIADTKTATELKRARAKQQIDDELTIDIARYAKKPDVNRLVCFVYDPDGFLTRDAAQIEKDLSGHRTHDGCDLDVIVLIRPK